LSFLISNFQPTAITGRLIPGYLRPILLLTSSSSLIAHIFFLGRVKQNACQSPTYSKYSLLFDKKNLGITRNILVVAVVIEAAW
jgi:hypothetical protein